MDTRLCRLVVVDQALAIKNNGEFIATVYVNDFPDATAEECECRGVGRQSRRHALLCDWKLSLLLRPSPSGLCACLLLSRLLPSPLPP